MTDPAPDPAAPDPAALARLLLDLDLPEACREGVAANLQLLAAHRRILEDEA